MFLSFEKYFNISRITFHSIYFIYFEPFFKSPPQKDPSVLQFNPVLYINEKCLVFFKKKYIKYFYPLPSAVVTDHNKVLL